MGVLPQALEIMFEVHWKRSNENLTRTKKKAFQLTNCVGFFFLLGFQISQVFLFLIHLQQF